MKKGMLRLFGLIIFAVIIFSQVREANAIPTFARKYRTSCTTCHIGFGKLNAFGEAYRLNAYNIPDGDAAYVKEEVASLGAPAWAKVWPDAVWPGAIPGAIPLSFMIHQRLKVEQHDETSTVDFNFPHEFEFLFGGTFGEFASFFAEYVPEEDGAAGSVEQAFIQFNDIFAKNFGTFLPENLLNIKVGKFQIAAEPLYDPTRRMISHPDVNNYTVGSNGWNFRDPQSGFEANGIVLSRLKYALGVVNGNGDAVEDDNHRKDFYWRVSGKLGGMAYDGSGAEESGEELKQTNNWVDDSIELGTFGYVGTDSISYAAWPDGGGNPAVQDEWRLSEFYRIGGDARVKYDNLNVFSAFVYGRDDKAFADLTQEVDSYAWCVGGEYVIFPWLIGSTRYEENDVGGGQADNEILFLSLAMYPRANIRAITEFRYYPEADGHEDGANLITVDLAYTF